jgi:Fe-Mn family superoxide dismutase
MTVMLRVMSDIQRRTFIKLGVAAVALPATLPAAEKATPFTLPDLTYAADALEPHIDARTMGIHHDKHHAAYIAKLNEALQAHADLAGESLDALQGKISAVSDAMLKATLRNNGGGHWNHSFFWNTMAPSQEAGKPGGKLLTAITAAFGSLDEFKKLFADAAIKRFGSGWAWLISQNGKLKIVSTANQDNPMMKGIVADNELGIPLLALDVWEHAYYLHYQNRRADYITAWWNVVNWNAVNKRFAV